MSDLPPHDRFPYGLDPERPRPWLDDEPPHHAGDDDDDQARGGMKTHRETASPDAPAETDVIAAGEQAARPTTGSSPVALAHDPEPERLRCRSCGGLWDEPKLNADGVCPFCVLELNER